MVEMITNSLPTRYKLSDKNSCNDNKLLAVSYLIETVLTTTNCLFLAKVSYLLMH